MYHKIHHTIVTLVFLAFFVGNTFALQSTSLGLILLIFYLLFFGWELGGLITTSEKAILRWWLGVWLLLSLIMIIGSAAYYTTFLTAEVVYVIVLLTPPIVLWAATRHKHKPLMLHAHDLWKEKRHRIPGVVFLLAALFLVLLSMYFSVLGDHLVTDSVRSVWERVPGGVFQLFALASLVLFALLLRGKERALTILLYGGILFAAVSVVAIVFPLGFGFDSFIHKATESHLAEFGTISPKPFYYIGQYALVLFAHHGFLLPVGLVDTYLLPTLIALLLPSAWYFAAAHITRKKSVAMATLPGVFLLPLSGFIVTTPQGLANLWTLLIVLASVPFLLEKEHPRLLVLGLTAVATLLIHPIAGIPVMLYLALLFSDPSRIDPRTPVLNRILRIILIAFASVVLPLSFLVNALISGQSLGIDWAALNPLTWLGELNISVFFENRFEPLLDLVYLYGLNATLIVFAIAGMAWVMYRKELSTRFRVLVVMTLVLAINYLIMSTTLEFTFLIDYERSNYAARLVPLMVLFLSPLLILGLSHLLINLKSRPLVLRTCALVLFVAIATSTVYMSYPRRDAYDTSRGFNVGQSDIDAVYLIETLAGEEEYAALANQSVSAAAISEIGFRYYNDFFFYPIPTGGAMYEYFLDMNEMPTREKAQEALALIDDPDVETMFYVVNNYWWEAPRIIETAKSNADDWRSVGDEGQVYIFKYEFGESTVEME